MKKPNYKDYDGICFYLRDYRQYLKATSDGGFSQGDIAKKCKLKNGQFLSNIERGLCLPPADLTIKLFELYGIDRVIAYELFLKERKRELQKSFQIGSRR